MASVDARPVLIAKTSVNYSGDLAWLHGGTGLAG